MYKYYYIIGVLITCFYCEPYNLQRLDFSEPLTIGFQRGENPTKAILQGEIRGLGPGIVIEQHGHVWSSDSTTVSLENAEGQTRLGVGNDGSFVSEIENLTPGRTYFYRSYLMIASNTKYGEMRSFKADDLSISFNLAINSCDSNSLTAALTINAELEAINVIANAFGVVWSTYPLPGLNNDATYINNENFILNSKNQFNHKTSLTAGTNYFRPYLSIEDTVYYGESVCCSIDNLWTRLVSFPGKARNGAVSFSIGSNGYVGLGAGENIQLFNDFWKYDSRKNSWQPIKDFPGVARSNAVAFIINGKAYVGTGESNVLGLLKDFWEYDPEDDSWRQISDFTGSGRSNATAFVIDNYGYVGLGFGKPVIGALNDFWRYHQVSDSWTPIDSFPGGKRGEAVGFEIGGQGYVGGGTEMRFTGNGLSDFWRYDGNSNRWDIIEPMPGQKRTAALAFSIDGYGIVGTGFNNGDGFAGLRDFYSYSLATNDWKAIRFLPDNSFSRSRATGFAIENRIYTGTGSTDIITIQLADFWSYAIQTDTCQ